MGRTVAQEDRHAAIRVHEGAVVVQQGDGFAEAFEQVQHRSAGLILRGEFRPEEMPKVRWSGSDLDAGSDREDVPQFVDLGVFQRDAAMGPIGRTSTPVQAYGTAESRIPRRLSARAVCFSDRVGFREPDQPVAETSIGIFRVGVGQTQESMKAGVGIPGDDAKNPFRGGHVPFTNFVGLRAAQADVPRYQYLPSRTNMQGSLTFFHHDVRVRWRPTDPGVYSGFAQTARTLHRFRGCGARDAPGQKQEGERSHGGTDLCRWCRFRCRISICVSQPLEVSVLHLALLGLTLALAAPAHAGGYEVVGPKRHAKAAVSGIVGDWVPLPPQEVATQVALLRRLLQEPPPTNEELVALGVQGEELEQAMVMRDNMADAVGRSMAESTLAALDAIRVQITRDQIIISALGQNESAAYRVTRASGDRVDVLLTRSDGRQEPGAFVIQPDGTLVALENGVEKLRFRRSGG